MHYQSTTLGMPRIGQRRELKFAIEQYWRGEVNQAQLIETAKEVVAYNQSLQERLDMRPIGDFSFYDRILDVCMFFDMTPQRFQGGVHSLDDYFTLARGANNVPAMEMTKWFDTNYHYIVPEITNGCAPQFTPTFLDLMLDIQGDDLTDRSYLLLGPLTFLKLAKSQDGSDKYAIAEPLHRQYMVLLQYLADKGIRRVHIEEPALGLDLTAEEKKLATYFYSTPKKVDVYIQLTLSYGEVRDNLDGILAHPDGIDSLHIDVHSEASFHHRCAELVQHFSEVSLGVIDGRNVWKMDLLTVAQRIQQCLSHGDTSRLQKVYLAPNTSLLHLPYSLSGEDALNAEVKTWLSFAQEKIEELIDLRDYLNSQFDQTHARAGAYTAIADARRTSAQRINPQVQEALGAVSDDDYDRSSPFEVRHKKQEHVLGLSLLPTTTIGSYPQTDRIRQARKDYRQGRIQAHEYKDFIRAEIKHCIAIQEELGLDVLVHGEPERNDMVQYFGEMLNGFIFSQHGWVQSYGTRCVKPPIIYGDVSRSKPMTIEWIQFAQTLTKKPLKGMLTGPVTMLQWSYVRDDQEREVTCKQIALALREEILDLEKAGISIIQVDEAALREGLPLRRDQWKNYLRWAVDAFRLGVSSARDTTQIHTHMCYSEFNDIIESIARMDADVISIECSRSKMELLDAFRHFKYPNEIGPGIWDIHSPRVPSKEEIVTLLQKAVATINAQHIWVNPDCGLKTRNWSEVKESLTNMIAARDEVMRSLSAG